jgi:hypothetical protein
MYFEELMCMLWAEENNFPSVAQLKKNNFPAQANLKQNQMNVEMKTTENGNG